MLNPESRILGPQFESVFSLKNFDLKRTVSIINANLYRINGEIFNPIESIKTLPVRNGYTRTTPFYNKFYSDFSSEGINILETPIEALFVTLSKISWNKKLKLSKRSKIKKTCYLISGVESPPELTPNQIQTQNQQLELHNLRFMQNIYQTLFKELSFT
jgi:hypothetical protein